MGIGLVLRVGVVPGRALAAHQTSAAIEHIIGSRYSLRAPILAHIDGSQVGAATKHTIHICHLCRVETAQVKARKITAATEHTLHACHIGCVEVAYVKARQARAPIEHL